MHFCYIAECQFFISNLSDRELIVSVYISIKLFLILQNEGGNRSLFDQLEDFRIDPPQAEDTEVEFLKIKYILPQKDLIVLTHII